MTPAEQIKTAIDRGYAQRQGDGLRYHLGASVLGRACPREIWYIFRWARVKRHTGRMLRLFERGHNEEEQVVKWLREIGAVVENVDPETGKQWQIPKRKGGHIGGSGDSRVSNLDRFGLPGRGLLEIKTSADKYFKTLKQHGVRLDKPDHYAQMQSYMGGMQLPWALYVAINKNDDELHTEVVHFDQAFYDKIIERAEDIVDSQHPPKRINKSASWYQCKMCDYRDICHYGEPPAKNCRSCINAVPDDDGEWFCTKWHSTIPRDFLRKGCDNYEALNTGAE